MVMWVSAYKRSGFHNLTDYELLSSLSQIKQLLLVVVVCTVQSKTKWRLYLIRSWSNNKQLIDEDDDDEDDEDEDQSKSVNENV